MGPEAGGSRRDPEERAGREPAAWHGKRCCCFLSPEKELRRSSLFFFFLNLFFFFLREFFHCSSGSRCPLAVPLCFLTGHVCIFRAARKDLGFSISKQFL